MNAENYPKEIFVRKYIGMDKEELNNNTASVGEKPTPDWYLNEMKTADCKYVRSDIVPTWRTDKEYMAIPEMEDFIVRDKRGYVYVCHCYNNYILCNSGGLMNVKNIKEWMRIPS